MRNFSTLSAAIALAVLSACASSRDLDGLEASLCGNCHLANPHGAAVASHPCSACHVTSFVPGSTTAVAGPAEGGTHSDGQVNVLAHGAGWTVANASGVTPHGMAALYRSAAAPDGMDGCRSCHGAALDVGVVAGVTSCNNCHSAWRTSCTFCHGDGARTPANLRAAPPRDVDGATASARIGAHQVHLVGAVVSRGVSCGDCHGGADRSLPGDFVHANGTTEVTLKRPGQNAATGTYDPATGTCANTYCHGNLVRNPKAGSAPAWTATGGQSGCDACHAPNGALSTLDAATDRHGAHMCNKCHIASGSSVGCVACHEGYQRQIGAAAAVVNLDLHVDGMVEVVQTTIALRNGRVFHISYDPQTRSCSTDCHGLQIAGGLTVHGGANPATW